MSPASRSNKCVLVVDDDVDIRESLEMALGAHGYSAIMAEDGAEALATLRDGTRPCLILLDLMMPGMNGIEFRAAQTRERDLSEIPVVVITGAGKLADDNTETLGVEIMRKPIELKTLISTVKRYCHE